ncbi:hypothetical protein I307_00311 [Cryptococcus deuterogattii 99/473]|uniref:PXA domain-containing protein n=1 Tax=Cryptococcus deuterogattii Ram5 TaxID=1296110 RepID=A0A0D0VFQ1_9TREE|nr:hypothetical protein I313_00492 [Cryptococcus deuterogattii Ram5]KIY60508.1 hypothetical protein I307_00311 [Cryptococcus deuterogattii 99/473]
MPSVALSSPSAAALVALACMLLLYIPQLLSCATLCLSILSLALAALFYAALTTDYARTPQLLRHRNALYRLRLNTVPLESPTKSPARSPLSTFSSQVNSAVSTFVGLVVQHFVIPWYSRISPSAEFPDAFEELVQKVIVNLVEKSDKVDWPSFMVSKILPIITDHLQHYRAVEHLSLAPQPLPLPLPQHPHKALIDPHLAAQAIEEHFRQTLSRILPDLLPKSEQTPVVLTLVQEILLGSVVLPGFQMVCESDFWNRQIDERVGQYLHERKQVDQFLSALSSIPSTSPSEGSPTVTRVRHKSHAKTPSIDANSSSSQFDFFLKSIRKLWTLGEARRLKADVERELRSAKLTLYEENKEANELGLIHQSSDKGPSKDIRKAQKYVERLKRAKSAIDSRIVELSGGKFMDRRHRSRLVQYWLTIEGFKDPLEATGTDVIEDGKPAERNAPHDTAIEDVQSLCATYFSAPQSGSVVISPQNQQIIEAAASSSHNLSPQDIARVRRAVFASQREVQLNFLIGNAENSETDGRDRLFRDEPEDLEEKREREEEARRIEAIQAALSEIIADDNGKRSSDGTPSDVLMNEREKPRNRGNDMTSSLILGGVADKEEGKQRSRSLEDLRSASLSSTTAFPSDASLSQEPIRNPSKLLFEDDLPDDDLSGTPSEGEEDSDIPHNVPLPAPGDLQLTAQISELGTKLIELEKQNELLSTLIRQAELTGNQKELKILRKSQSSVQRVTRAKQWQKQEFERAQDESRLMPSRTRISIPSAAVTEDTENASASTLGVVGPKQVVRYDIHVCQIDDGHPAAKWAVSRRYNEFWELDKNLREWASEHGALEAIEALRKLEIPGKSLVGNISANFVESRRIGLEKYLQSISPGPSSEDTFNASMVDVMYNGLGRQISDLGGLVGVGLGSPEVEVTEGHVQVTRDVSVEGMTSFTGPICDLFIELFDLKEKNWLRRQAVIVILQQFLGGTIERTSTALRSEEEKAGTRARAGKKLGLLIPDIAANMIGRGNARRAARRYESDISFNGRFWSDLLRLIDNFGSLSFVLGLYAGEVCTTGSRSFEIDSMQLSHAVVGMFTIWWREVKNGRPAQRGRIEFIMVDSLWLINQMKVDAKWSVYIFTGNYSAARLSSITFTTCRSKICAWVFRWIFCNKGKASKEMDNYFAATRTRNEKASYYHDDNEDDGGPTEHDLHVSQDIIIGCSILVGILLWVAWNWDDSIYLRFVMLGMGLLSALYAVWDIALDGIKYAEVTESDATLMAEVYNHTIQEHNRRVSYDERPLSETYRKPQHPHHPKRERGARFYAFIWLFAKVIVIIAVLIGAYFSFRETIAQQAIRSREFLPAQFHYGPADLRDDTKNASDAVSDTVSGWIDDK